MDVKKAKKDLTKKYYVSVLISFQNVWKSNSNVLYYLTLVSGIKI